MQWFKHCFWRETPTFKMIDNVLIHTTGIVIKWHEEHSNDALHLIWPPQSPDLNIIEHLWSIQEMQVRSWSPPPSSLKELEGVLTKEWI
jgi:transposase